MSTVVEIETALRELPLAEARRVSDWLTNYLETQWDRQIDQDIDNGKFDKLAEQALERYRSGSVRPLNEVIDHP